MRRSLVRSGRRSLSTLEGGIVLKNTSPSVLGKAVESLTDETTRKHWDVRAPAMGSPLRPRRSRQEVGGTAFFLHPSGKKSPFASSIVPDHLSTC